MTHYSSHTQPRRSMGHTNPSALPHSTLPRSSMHDVSYAPQTPAPHTSTLPRSSMHDVSYAPQTPAPHTSTLPRSSMHDVSYAPQTPAPHTAAPRTRPYSTSMTPRHNVLEGDRTLTSKILSTAGQTGSTQDLRLLLHDALSLTEKLNSVSSTIGRGASAANYEHHRLSSHSSYPRSPGAYSETGSVFRAHSVDNGLDCLPSNGISEQYETSTSLAAILATPVRKSVRPNFQNGHSSPPPPLPATLRHRGSPPPLPATLLHRGSPPPPLPATLLHRGSSPLLQNKRSVSSDYAVPRSVSTSRSVSQQSGESGGENEAPHSESRGDNVDVGLDCIAQLEELEKELQSFQPTAYPQREGKDSSQDSKEFSQDSSQDSKQFSQDSSQDNKQFYQDSSSTEGHYEVDPYYTFTKKEKSVPPSQRVGGRPSVADFVDELTEVEHQVSWGPEDPEGHRTRGMTASSATRELDELMANLTKFEPSTGKGDYDKVGNEGGRTKSTAMDNLNSMLGCLDEDMTKRHGVDTAPKGMCAACNKPILTKVVNALGCQWHKEHFTCAQCDEELGSTTYYESNGRPYCEKDYHELFAPRCAYCNGPILERVLRALDKTWHKEHFFCTLCGKDFGPEGFHEKDSKAFCRECYYEKFAPRCKRCEKAIMEGFITALGSQWHPECFCCKVCGVTFPRGNYFDHEGEPHCEIHYHASRGTLCASCQKPVTGKCITAMGRKWHPEHFTCAFCLKLLNKGTFKEHRHNPYCQPCYIKLFG